MNLTEKICQLFSDRNIPYDKLSHPQTPTSEESRKARIEAGGEDVIGAKAILMKMERKSKEIEFNIFVLPGDRKIDSKTLKNNFSDIKNIRFATLPEMSELTGGLVPGSLPPFTQPILQNLAYLYVDRTLLNYEKIGFNAASLTQSLIVQCQDYIQVANPTAILSFSQ